MGRNKSNRENIRSLTKVGGSSYAVTIPKDFVRKLKWREKQKLEVKLYQDHQLQKQREVLSVEINANFIIH